MATPTLANPLNVHQFLARVARPVASPRYPKSQPDFRVFPTGEAEYYWRIAASATNQTISRHKSLSFALRKCTRLNEQRSKAQPDPLKIALSGFPDVNTIAHITKESDMTSKRTAASLRMARRIWAHLSREALSRLREIAEQHNFSIAAGDLTYLDNGWYVTHTGLLGLARRNRCAGIHVRPVPTFCDPSTQRWAFEATVYKSRSCRGFSGYGDADPSNVSFLVHGAEMRVAETRAVNRALRKAYGIGLCSVEEIGSLAEPPAPSRKVKKLPQPSNGNGNFGGRTVRDRLCQLIRQHQLDATLVKAYATDFCGVKVLREATREQVENFVKHLAEWAESDRNALLCQLNSYLGQKTGVA